MLDSNTLTYMHTCTYLHRNKHIDIRRHANIYIYIYIYIYIHDDSRILAGDSCLYHQNYNSDILSNN